METADILDDLLREKEVKIDKHMNRRGRAITAADPGEGPGGGGGAPPYLSIQKNLLIT